MDKVSESLFYRSGARYDQAFQQLDSIAGLEVGRNEPLSRHTRFGIGGPAAIFADAGAVETFLRALEAARETGLPLAVLGGGTNLIVSDSGFDGIVLRFRADGIVAEGNQVTADAGAELQALVDFTIDRGLKGLETMTGIPGWVGAAIYGNAGAYGHSISERVRQICFFDGCEMRLIGQAECAFSYRDSVFKRHKNWIILSVELELEPAEAGELRRRADEIRKIRDTKYPPSMRCAGSIFKNCLLAELPGGLASQVPLGVIREGKVPSAWFLEQAGAKGMRRGQMRVADYHANLIYNTGGGSAADLCELIAELKRRVRERFGLELEEEVQYVGT